MTNSRKLVKCAWCQSDIMRHHINRNTKLPIANFFCSTLCKGDWQRENQKPKGVTKAWLIEQYEVNGLDCAEIGRLVKRDTKRVWEWLRDYGIVTRTRGTSTGKQWANGSRVHPGGYAHTEENKEYIRQLSLQDGRVPYRMPDGSHYMKGRRGAEHHGWQGGLTPEREALAHSQEWKDAVKFVWHRADAKCERCGLDHRAVDNRKSNGFHIHHIAPFRVVEKRTDTNNLALLCRPCHHWVHSKKNIHKEYIENGN